MSASLLFAFAVLAQEPATAETTAATPTSTSAPAKTIVAEDPVALEKGAAAALARQEDPNHKVAVVVLDLRADGVEPSLASAVSSVVGSELFDLGVLQVTTEEDVRRMMDFEQMKLILACQDEAKCLTSFQQALGAEMLVTGSVGTVPTSGGGNDIVVGLVLNDVAAGLPIGREVATVKTPSGLVSELRVALGRLFRPVLAKRGGTLVVLGNETGATVLVDGAAVGTTPFRKDNVPSGPHRIEAVKDGFMKGSVDVTVQPTQTVAVDVLLIPSKEMSELHKRNNTILRVVSIASAGVGVGALATGGAVWWYQYDKVNNPQTGYVAQYAKDNGGALLLPTPKYNEVSQLRLLSYVVTGAAVPLFVAGGVLWAVSDDPAKYDALLSEDVSEAQ